MSHICPLLESKLRFVSNEYKENTMSPLSPLRINTRIPPWLAGKSSISHAITELTSAAPEKKFAGDGLMPYEAVAKAIFIKANGSPAYYKATGLPEH
ncbi:hypothetical protein DLREEDagrD3_24220 [Denitratisoma sp. agr-D3]